jgi:hypothetical protein
MAIGNRGHRGAAGAAPSPGMCHANGTAPTMLGLPYFETQTLAPFLVPVFVIFVAMMVVRNIIFHLVLPRIADFALGPEGKEPKLHRRFKESGWRACLYGFASVYVLNTMLLSDSCPWVYDTRRFWEGFPLHASDGLFSVYALYFAMYMHELVYVFIDTSGDDFLAMVVHHIVTIALLASSWSVGFIRIGSFVTALHDVSDFLLMFAKCFNYAKVRHPSAEMVADGVFVIFTISFYGLRLGIYPSQVLRPVLFGESCQLLSCPCRDKPAADCDLAACWSLPAWPLFAVLLCALQLLQIFWGWKLARAVYKKVIKGELTDVREE